MPYLVLGVAVLIGALLVARWYVSAQPATLSKTLKWIFIILAVLVAGALIFTGRIGWGLLAIQLLLVPRGPPRGTAAVVVVVWLLLLWLWLWLWSWSLLMVVVDHILTSGCCSSGCCGIVNCAGGVVPVAVIR